MNVNHQIDPAFAKATAGKRHDFQLCAYRAAGEDGDEFRGGEVRMI